MIFTTQKPFVLVPDDQQGQPEALRIAYRISTPTPFRQAELRRRIRAHPGAIEHSPAEKLRCLTEGVIAIFEAAAPGAANSMEGGSAAGGPTADSDRMIAEIADYKAALEAYIQMLPGARENELIEGYDEFARKMERVEAIGDIVARSYVPYREMRNDVATYGDIATLESARMYVCGWDNLPAPWAAARDGDTAPDLLAYIPPLHMAAISGQIIRMLRPDAVTAKNSESSPPSTSGPTSSKASRTSTRAAAGKPSKTAGT